MLHSSIELRVEPFVRNDEFLFSATSSLTYHMYTMTYIYIYTGNRVQELRVAQSGGMVVTRLRDLFGAGLQCPETLSKFVWVSVVRLGALEY
jgi:hypothetical protein